MTTSLLSSKKRRCSFCRSPRPGMWILTGQEPSFSRLMDLDGDGGCRFYAYCMTAESSWQALRLPILWRACRLGEERSSFAWGVAYFMLLFFDNALFVHYRSSFKRCVILRVWLAKAACALGPCCLDCEPICWLMGQRKR